MRNLVLGVVAIALAAGAAAAASDVKTGPSSSQPPYVIPVADKPAGVSTRSILTVGDSAAGYTMVGIPDGLGAFDNGDGTFTLLSNHELGSASGTVRAHGAKGAFVSRWVIDKDALEVRSGSDLIQDVYTAKVDGTYNPDAPVAFNRLCSADLPELTAFYDAASGKGYDGRIFMNGEESGAEGRAFAHFVTGPEAGSSYELPFLGRFSWENSVAHPNLGDRTVVIGQDDSAPTASVPNNGQVYVYAGDKSATGSSVARAGLAGGSLYGIQLRSGGAPLPTEFSKSDWAVGDQLPFAAVDVSGDRKDPLTGAWSGDRLQTQSVAKGVTGFERPEDGAWDPSNPSDYYFVTTSNIVPELGRSGHTRLWRLRFADPARPALGGTVTLLVNGRPGRPSPTRTTGRRCSTTSRSPPGARSSSRRIPATSRTSRSSGCTTSRPAGSP